MMHTALRRLGAISALLLVALVASCDSVSGPRFGRLSLLLTDAPGDVEAAVVTIERIYLQGGVDDSDDDTTAVDDSTGVPDDDESGRVVLLDSPITVDLLTLRDSLMPVLDSALVPAGRYGQLRLVVSGGYLAVSTGDSTPPDIYASSPTYHALPDSAVIAGELQMPSYASSGLKVRLPADAIRIVGDGVVTMVIDFDVAQSFGRAAGHSGRWVMRPVITATAPAAP